jgi:hypothetical protein
VSKEADPALDYDGFGLVHFEDLRDPLRAPKLQLPVKSSLKKPAGECLLGGFESINQDTARTSGNRGRSLSRKDEKGARTSIRKVDALALVYKITFVECAEA